MTPEQLKASILQYAIQGKLVEQRPEEGTGEELYRQIQAEKQRLLKEGKIKKEKALPEIVEDEIPFDIPDGWKWVRLPEIGTSSLGKTLNKGLDAGNEVPYLCSINVYWDGINLNQIKTAKFTVADMEKYLLRKGDLLICEGGDVGRSAVWDRDMEMYYQNALHCVRFFGQINPYYFKYCFELYKHNRILENASKGMTIKHLVQGSLYAILFPLPPLAEQKRIVAKIEKLLPYVDRYSAAYEKLEQFNAKFPEDMKKSILQYAIQGKLVEQRPEEGTGEELYRQIQTEKQRLIKEGRIKKEKPLDEIPEDEIPFDIPESWKWVRLNTIGITQTGNTPSKSHPEYIGIDIPFITPGDILNGQIGYSNQALSLLGKEVARVCCAGSIMQVCIGGSIGKAAITDREVAFNQQINVVSPIACVSEYLFAVMQSAYFTTSMKERAGGTATPIINRGLWDALLIPLPPLAEQKRIVAKLEEILPLCERLK